MTHLEEERRQAEQMYIELQRLTMRSVEEARRYSHRAMYYLAVLEDSRPTTREFAAAQLALEEARDEARASATAESTAAPPRSAPRTFLGVGSGRRTRSRAP